MRAAVADTLKTAPVIGVVRTESRAQAASTAAALRHGGIGLVEITFTVPEATEVVAELLAARAGDGPPWIGMGTVTDRERAEAAVAVGAEFLVSPNVDPEVAAVARRAGLFLVLGALTCSEILTARRLGADLVKVYPLPAVGGPDYLKTIRQPLDDVPMLAAGGFGVEEIPAYRRAGAVAFGIGPPLVGADDDETRARVMRALTLAREGAA